MTSRKEGSDIEAGKGELRRGRGKREGYHRVALRGALAQGWQGMVRSRENLNGKKKKRDQAGRLSGDHIAMRGSQKTKGTTTTKTANREIWAGDVESEWGEPISEKAKQWVSWHFEEKLRRDHGGALTQEAACALTKKDKKLQRYVNSEGLQMRASDVAWAWVAQQVMPIWFP